MTFDEIVDRVKDRLNLTSVEATARIGENLNDRYRQVTSSIGLEPVRMGTSDITVNTTNYPDLPEMEITTFDKLTKVSLVDGTAISVLRELTYDEITNLPTNSATPNAWAVKLMDSHTVTIVLDGYSTDNFILRLQGYTRLTDISGTTEPVFPEDFHDILVHGAMADELRKMEKYPLATEREAKFEMRLSDLRMFIAKSAYLDIAQGKNKPSSSWYWPWVTRTTVG